MGAKPVTVEGFAHVNAKHLISSDLHDVRQKYEPNDDVLHSLA